VHSGGPPPPSEAPHRLRARLEQQRILVPGVAVVQLARFEVEHRRDQGHEELCRIVAGNLGIGRAHDVADVGTWVAQHRALVQRLAHRHENARRESLAGDVADENEQPAMIETEEIVQIAADFARRRHHRGEIDARVVAQQLGARQRRRLYLLRGFELAGHACALLALTLHGLLENTALPRRFGQRQHEQDAEEESRLAAGMAASNRTCLGAKQCVAAVSKSATDTSTRAPHCAASIAAWHR
jgi:hypothetical protein